MSFNFNRRPKRVAGPGFYINSRFDDFTTAKMRGKMGVSNGNSFLPPARSAECYDVKEQELLVTMKDNASYHDGYVHVLSCINGLDAKGSTAEEVKEDVLNRVQFIGLAQTEFHSDNKAYMEQGLVATVGGVETILNDGEDDIHAGDLVALDLNLNPGRFSQTRSRGIPREKIRFTVKRADDDEAVIKKCLAKACGGPNTAQAKALDDANTVYQKKRAARKKALKNSTNGNNEQDPAVQQARQEEKDALKVVRDKEKACKGISSLGDTQAIKKFLKLYRLHNDRIIGKAMSFARKGDRFEILLALRHAR